MENSITKMGGDKISNWDKPGGTLGMIVAGLAITGILYFVLPILKTIIWNAVSISIGVGILAAILFLLTDKSCKRVISTAYFMIMRSITGFFIDIDPVAIVERRLRQMEKKIDEMGEKMGILKGFNIKTTEAIEDKKRKLTTEKLRIETYRERGEEDAAAVSNNQLIRYNEQIINLTKRLENGNKMYEILSQLERKAKLTVEDTRNSVEAQKENYELAKQQYKVFSSVMSILNGDPDEMAQYQMAMDKMAKEVNDKVGEMSHVLDQTGGILMEFSIDNSIASKKTTELMTKYDKYGVDGMFSSNEKQLGTETVNYVNTGTWNIPAKENENIQVGSTKKSKYLKN